MAAVMEREEVIFESAAQAVHVAFLIMAQPAMQDAPLRKALIRIMESINLMDGRQRHWLDQLRGVSSGTVNFSGLAGGDIRAQCAMITQAVKKLPNIEMWVLQAKYGQTDFEDVEVENGMVQASYDKAQNATAKVRVRLAGALSELEDARGDCLTASAAGHFLAAARYNAAREAVRATSATLALAERAERVAKLAVDRITTCAALDNGPPDEGMRSRRRFAFSAERIAAIQGLSEWFAPMFPRIKVLAIDCMLGRMFANHKKIDISARDLAAQFGGSHMQYIRAGWKMKNHLRILEDQAIARLAPGFEEHGVSASGN